jgi:non-heme chloroperoxidase
VSRSTTPGPAFIFDGRVSKKNAGVLVAAAAAVAGAGAAAVVTGRRWRSAADPCAETVLELNSARTFKVERPDGAVLDGVAVGPEDGRPGGMGGAPPTKAAGAATGTVVLSHCWTGSRATWEPVAARLVSAGRRVVLYDQRGHGASTLGPDAPTVEQLGEDLAAVLEAVDACDAVVAGHSMGGMAIQALAIARPDVVAERVRALVLAGTAGFGVAGGPLSAATRFATGDPRIDRFMAGRLGPALIRGAVGRHPRQAHLLATRDAYLSLPTAVRRQFLIALQDMDFRADLASVAVPTTVVVGSRDLLTPPRLSRGLAAAIPGARLVELDGAGHMLPYEEPDRLAEIILSAGAQSEGGAS